MKYCGWLLVAVFACAITLCVVRVVFEARRRILAEHDRRFTITALSETGVVIGQWTHCRITGGRSGWVIAQLPDGRTVIVDGPHTCVEE